MSIGVKFKKPIHIRRMEVNDWGRGTPLIYQASNDGVNWTNLYQNTGDGTLSVKIYNRQVDDIAYQYYRMYIGYKNVDARAIFSSPRIYI